MINQVFLHFFLRVFVVKRVGCGHAALGPVWLKISCDISQTFLLNKSLNEKSE